MSKFETPDGIQIGNANGFIANSSSLSIGGNKLLPATIDVGAVIGDGTNVIPTGRGGRFIGPFDFNFTITAWSLLGALESGSIAITLYKCTYANYDPVSGSFSAMCPVGNITMSSVTKQQGTVSGWSNTNVAAGEILLINVESVTSLRQAILTFKATKTS
jgi:hypothetical protein